MTVIDVTDATFQTDVLDKSSEVPVVIDLWAPWCGPCKTLGPILEKVIGETNGKVVLAKVNVDENPGLHQAFKVQSIPAVYAMKDGAVVDGFMGSYPERARQGVRRLADLDRGAGRRGRTPRRRRRGQPADRAVDGAGQRGRDRRARRSAGRQRPARRGAGAARPHPGVRPHPRRSPLVPVSARHPTTTTTSSSPRCSIRSRATTTRARSSSTSSN